MTAIERAAQCWCDPRVSDRVMDPELCTVIAEQITAACEAAVENAYGPSRIAFYEKGFAEARERAAEFVDKHFDNTTSQWISQRIRALTPDRQEKI